jgi:hypothetical protein
MERAIDQLSLKSRLVAQSLNSGGAALERSRPQPQPHPVLGINRKSTSCGLALPKSHHAYLGDPTKRAKRQ